MRITDYIEGGNSFPVILEFNNQKYFVKLRAGMSSKHSLVSEWIGNKLGQQLGIKTQDPLWVELQKEVEIGDIHIEVRELISKSVGINIGFHFYASANAFDAHDIKTLPKETRNAIFLFDLLMINVDRTPDNINLMKVNQQVFSIDYESSLLFQEILEQKNLLNDERILQSLRNNPLYSEIDEETIDIFVEKASSIALEEIIFNIPIDLLSESDRVLFVNGIEERKRHAWFLKETIKKLKQIKTESAEDLKMKRNKNQAAFLKKFKENLK